MKYILVLYFYLGSSANLTVVPNYISEEDCKNAGAIWYSRNDPPKKAHMSFDYICLPKKEPQQ